MPLRKSLLGSRTGSVKSTTVTSARVSLTPEALTTGGLLLTGAGLALLGPLLAAMLIRASGAGRTDAAATTPLVLAMLAVIITVAGGFALFVSAWRRAHTPAPRRVRSVAAVRAKSVRSEIDSGGGL
ncbi:hypothetical protein [Nocardia africana]